MRDELITYRPEFKRAFQELNLEWIERYFKVEKKDLEQTNHPERCLEGGGQIFFVLHGGEAVGTCAMYRIAEGVFELAKMAVRPSRQGKGYGDLLMVEAEEWARTQGAREIVILSNTVLQAAIGLYEKHGFVTTFLGPHPDYERCNIEMRKRITHNQNG